MSFCCQPCSFSFQARLRRSSRQSAFLGAPILLSYHTLLACAEISRPGLWTSVSVGHLFVIFAEADQHGDDVQAGRPFTVRLDMHCEAQTVLVDVSFSTGSNQGLSDKLFTTIAKHQAIALDPLVEFTFLLECILDLEQVGKVSRRLQAHLEVNRLVFVIEDGHILVEAVSYCSCANDRLISIHIDGAGSRNQEELHIEVVEVVRRQGVRT